MKKEKDKLKPWETSRVKNDRGTFFACSICGAYTRQSRGISYEYQASKHFGVGRMSFCAECSKKYLEPLLSQLNGLHDVKEEVCDKYKADTEYIEQCEEELFKRITKLW